MANHRHGRTYLGVTSDLARRVHEHRTKAARGYSSIHDCTNLVWCERFDDLQEARACEYRMKKWHRAWKLRLIDDANPGWRDLLYDDPS